MGCEGVLGGGPITFNKTKAVLAPPAVNILPAPHTVHQKCHHGVVGGGGILALPTVQGTSTRYCAIGMDFYVGGRGIFTRKRKVRDRVRLI